MAAGSRTPPSRRPIRSKARRPASAPKCACSSTSRHFYIGVICFDSEPDKIIVTQSRRDADLTETDAIILVLDTFNDNQNAFVFGTNPLGIEYDGQVAGEGQTSGIVQRQSGARRLAARHDQRVQR